MRPKRGGTMKNRHAPIEFYGISDVGMIRPNNEDVIASLPSHNFFALADGMGGHQAGEIAAKETTQELLSFAKKFLAPLKNLSQKQINTYILSAIKAANEKVYTLGQNNINFKGMGTTVCCCYLYNNTITYAHVGDSRLYLFRKNNLIQLTKDHSLISKLESSGQLKKGSSISNAYKNIITKAIGTTLNVIPSIGSVKYQVNDIFFMCSDGLSDYLSSDEISGVIRKNDIKKAVTELIDTAKKQGSRDNISSLLIKIKDF